MKIYYWSPFTSNVATIKAVINSAYGLKKIFKFNTYIINSFGEWNGYKKEIKSKKIKIINNPKNSKIVYTQGYLKSRIAFIRIFFHSFFFLKNILLQNRPEFLVVHLITSLPLILFRLFKFETKLVLRISGQPKLNYFRRLIWKISRQNIYCVTVPTKETLNFLKKMNIFDPSIIHYLPDPVFINKEINKYLKMKNKNNSKYIINIGRLTRQKNQKILIKSFKEISKNYKNLKLLILGKGEKYFELSNLVKQLNLENKVNFLGQVNSPYKYIKNSLCVIVSSLWEDPGFVMIESSALKKVVISSDCQSGPKEFFNRGKTGFLFKNNNEKSLINAFEKFMNSSSVKISQNLNKNYIKSQEYSEIYHSKIFKKILEHEKK